MRGQQVSQQLSRANHYRYSPSITMVWLFVLFVLLFAASLVQAAQVKNVRMWPAPDNTRLVFDLNGPVDHSLFILRNPDRIVIDIKRTRINDALNSLRFAPKGLVKNIRHAKRNSRDVRVVLDLKKQVRPKSFLLKPNRNYGHRLVIDLLDEKASKPSKLIPPRYKHRQRDIIVAIDAGHGGDDPGAIGRRGTREKVVVMQIARRLESLLKKEYGMKPVMIRRGDYYVGLKNRVRIARKAKADIFISLHADAFHNRKAHGTSVFIVSDRGASSEAARLLAASENQSDEIGGVDFDGIDDDLLKLVLVDMVKNSTMEGSHEAAGHVLRNLKSVTHLHKSHVEQAGFRVLKTPGIPSLLVETAFISNPKEEKKLRSSRHQQRLAKAILRGVKSYFRANPPPGTLLAQVEQDIKHKVKRGDTLSTIASRYRISVLALKSKNNIRSDFLKVGAVLRIPASG